MAGLYGTSGGGFAMSGGGSGRGSLFNSSQGGIFISSKMSSEASSSYDEAQRARAAVPEIDRSPTAGKNIPIFVGAVRLTGDVIWVNSYRTTGNECRADVAICFGRNLFGRALSLVSIAQSGAYIYKRSGGDVIDPPSAVRFYDGTQTTADPKIISVEGADYTPAFKGHVYAVLENVKLGDFSAEFTDDSTETSTSSSIPCSDDLSGIDLVYDDVSGLYYGIEFPMTGSSNLIVSDGCKIISRSVIPNYYRYNGAFGGGELANSTEFYCDAVYPLRCAGAVLVTGYDGYTHQNIAQTFATSFVVNPMTALPAGLDGDGYTIVDFNLFQKWSLANSSAPATTDIEYKMTYRLPGGGNLYFALRLFDPADCYAVEYIGAASPPAVPYTLPSDSNVCGSIINMSYGGLESHYAGTSDGNEDAGEFCTFALDESFTQYLNPTSTIENPEDGWYTSGCPAVDDIIYGTSGTSSVTLAAYKLSGSDINVFRILHTSSGMSLTNTATITPPSPLEFSGIEFDADSNQILISATPNGATALNARLYKVGPSGSISYIELDDQEQRIVSRSNAVSSGGNIVLSNEDFSKIYSHNVEAGTTQTLYDGVAPTRAPVIDLSRNTFSIPTAEGVTTYSSGQIVLEDILLTDIITDACAIKGYSPSDLVFENLSGVVVKGLLINSTIRLSDLFNRFGALYGFVFVETDRQLKFLKKRTAGGVLTTDATLTEDDLVLVDTSDGALVRTVQRSGANNLLSGMDFEFINPDKNFENDTIKIRRPTGSFDIGASTRLETLSLPLALDANTAYPLIYEAFYGLLQKETRSSFAVPSWHARIEPGDCISVTVDGVTIVGVAVRVTMRGDFAQEVEIESYMTSGVTSVSEVVDYNPVDPSGSSVIGWYLHLDIPFVRASDYTDADVSNLYHGITTRGIATWSGADVYRSRNSTSFTKLLEYDLPPMLVARCSNAIGQPETPFSLDDENELTVTVISGDDADLVSVTYQEMMEGANLCAYGRPGAWEIIAFQTVTDNEDGTFTLSLLSRGLFGSHVVFDPDVNTQSHSVGDYIVLLDPSKLTATNYAPTDYNINERFAVATSAAGIAQSATTLLQYKHVSMTPKPPASLTALHTAGSSNLVIEWEAVSSVPYDWQDSNAEGTIHETESYNVVIETVSFGDFEFTTSDRSYTWTAYGSTLGATSIADDVITAVRVSRTSTVWGTGVAAVTTAHED
jgi:hypothetical protein